MPPIPFLLPLIYLPVDSRRIQCDLLLEGLFWVSGKKHRRFAVLRERGRRTYAAFPGGEKGETHQVVKIIVLGTLALWAIADAGATVMPRNRATDPGSAVAP